jgi:NifB/MoaA-like Fe-S oxidoreductase
LVAGDEIRSISGVVPRDIIEYQFLVEEPELLLEIDRGGIALEIEINKLAGEPLGAEISSALFDRVRTCDNHCEFCFIYQLPKGMRRSLYLKDDDYRLSFLYGNFTTLTRFTEADYERVVTERLSPLFVSIHTTNPSLRAEMLRNPRGAISLRWLAALLDAGIEIHGQVVLCPGINDGAELSRTLYEIAINYPRLASVGVVPLGVSKFSHESRMVPATPEQARESLAIIHEYQATMLASRGTRLAYASDELYILAGEPFPPIEDYEGFPQHENGIGIYRAFEAAYHGDDGYAWGRRSGYFDSVDGAPKEGYRAVRYRSEGLLGRRNYRSTAIITSTYGAHALGTLLADELSSGELRLVVVDNEYFGGNIGVAGLMCGADVARRIAAEPEEDRYLLPDVCLNEGVFLDGMSVTELPRAVDVIATDGAALRRALRRRPLAVNA